MDGILNFMGNGGLIIAIILLIVAIVASIIRPLYDLATDFAESKKALIGVLGLVVLVLIGFALAGGEVPQYAVEKGISAKEFRMIGAAINTAIIAIVIVAVYLVVDIVLNIVRN